jgi:hypothetical protein
MPMDLLEELADLDLPCEISDRVEVDKLRVLLAAGHIDAVIPPVAHDQTQKPAIVLEITPLGRKALRFFGSPARLQRNRPVPSSNPAYLMMDP